MLLAIDVGNTNTVFGLYREQALAYSWRLATDQARTADELAIAIRELFSIEGLCFKDVDGAIISCVVPPLLHTLSSLCKKHFSLQPLVVDSTVETGLTVQCDNPSEVGADRIVNVVAAYALKQCSLIVVDFGTATTFDYLSADGEYQGGAIAPGLNISAEALYERASKLPRVQIACPPKVIATNTVESIQAGLFYGYVGLVDGIISRMKLEAAGAPYVLATGGLAQAIAPYSRMIDEVNDDLTMEGLRIIYHMNRLVDSRKSTN